MKQIKKVVLFLLCAAVLTGVTACGNDKDTTKTDNVNDATGGTKNEDGIIEDMGEDIKEGTKDVIDDLDEDGVPDEKDKYNTTTNEK